MKEIKKLLKDYCRQLSADETLELHRELIKTMASAFNGIPFTKVEIIVLTAALKYLADAYTSLLSEQDRYFIEAINKTLTSYAGLIPAGEVEN